MIGKEKCVKQNGNVLFVQKSYVQIVEKCTWVFVIVYEIEQGGIDRKNIYCYHF